MAHNQDYIALTEKLLTRVPELRASVNALMVDGEDPGPHVVFEDILVPHLIALLESGEHGGAVQRIFDLIEELSTSTVQAVRDVAGASVLEAFLNRPELESRAREFMRPGTLRLFEAIRKAWKG